MDFQQLRIKLLNEARSDKVEYKAFKGKKELKLPDDAVSSIEKVVAYIDSERREYISANKLAQTLNSISKRVKQLKEKEDTLKDKVRTEVIEKYFDLSDELYTRVIETNEAILSITKKSERKGSFMADEFFEEAAVLVGELAPKLEELRIKYTKAPTQVAPSVTTKLKEDISSSIKAIVSYFKSFFTKYDAKLAQLKKKYL